MEQRDNCCSQVPVDIGINAINPCVLLKGRATLFAIMILVEMIAFIGYSKS